MTIFQYPKCVHGHDYGTCHICEGAPKGEESEMDLRLLAAITVCRDYLQRYGAPKPAELDNLLRDAAAAVGELMQLRDVHSADLRLLERYERALGKEHVLGLVATPQPQGGATSE